jgi:hypothetical protein
MPKKGNIPWNKGKKGVQAGSFKGKHHSEETKELMRQKKLGKPGHHTQKHTEASIKKMSENRKGKSAWNKGIEMPQSFCDIMSRVQEGKTIPLDQRKKISQSLEGREKSEEHVLKVIESNSKEGFWYGHRFLKNPPRIPRYCELWKDVNPRVHAFFNYKCVECGAPEITHSHIGHHVFYVKETCCWFDDEGMYYTNLRAPDHKDEDYYIGENPNYFVILCSKCHGKTNGNFKNRKRWAEHFKEIIDTQYGGKCYLPK